MEIRDLLVLVDDQPGCGERVDAAFRVAGQFGASVTGLYVGLLPAIPGYVEAQLPDTLKDRRDQDVKAAASAARKIFFLRANESAGAGAWHEVIGSFPDIVRKVSGYARFADLTVMKRRWDESAAPQIAEEIVLSSGAPVLLLPDNGQDMEIGKRVLVGWNGSREAARALHDSIPFLQTADEVTLLTVETGEASSTETIDVMVHLSHHGIDANLRQAHVSGHDIGEVILSRATETGADLIVMGAYGHSRFRGLAMGTATRRVMRHSTIPVLMSH